MIAILTAILSTIFSASTTGEFPCVSVRTGGSYVQALIHVGGNDNDGDAFATAHVNGYRVSFHVRDTGCED